MCCFIVCLAWLEAVVAVQQLRMANHFAKDDAIGDDNNCGVGIIFFGLDVDVPVITLHVGSVDRYCSGLSGAP
jgi:hypothetical protein